MWKTHQSTCRCRRTSATPVRLADTRCAKERESEDRQRFVSKRLVCLFPGLSRARFRPDLRALNLRLAEATEAHPERGDGVRRRRTQTSPNCSYRGKETQKNNSIKNPNKYLLPFSNDVLLLRTVASCAVNLLTTNMGGGGVGWSGREGGWERRERCRKDKERHKKMRKRKHILPLKCGFSSTWTN